MSSVTQILQKNRKVHTVQDIDFLCREWGMALALEAFGPGAFAVVDDGEKTRVEVRGDALGDRAGTVEKVLRVVMISPALGDETDEDADTITFTDLGDLAYGLFSRVTGEVQASARDFPESSEGETAG